MLQASAFVAASHLHPSLMFVGKDGAYPSEDPYKTTL
jgi:hypothetical protein